jgi:hypothetical protein
MQKLTVGFSKSKKFLPIGSWLIRLYQWTDFSHVYLRRKSRAFDLDIIIHASEGLVIRMSSVQFDKKHTVVKEYEIEMTDGKYSELRNLMHYYSGDNYSVMQNLGIVLVDIARVFGWRIKNPWQKGWNCSEFVMAVLKEVFPDKFSGYDPNTVTPREIDRILTSLVDEEKALLTS